MRPQHLQPEEYMQQLLAVKNQREMEGLRCYRPMPKQEQFHRSDATQRIVRGGNRSGKTVAVGFEFASLVLRRPITCANGDVLPPKPLKFPHLPMIAWIVGYDQRHIGQTIYRVLFEPGYIQVIQDEETGQWRTFNPVTDEDRVGDSKPAEPLIPPSEIEKFAWEDRAGRVFKSCTLRNGNVIYAFPSTGEPKKGDPIDLLWIDEDVCYAEHVAEWQARLSDRAGRLIWSVWPLSSNQALLDMSQEAEEQAEWDRPDTQEVVLRFSDNPFIDSDEKRKRLQSWSEEERLSRDLGEFQFDKVLMYQWSPSIHGLPRKGIEEFV